jgi:hypothetical protein
MGSRLCVLFYDMVGLIANAAPVVGRKMEAEIE